MTFKLDRIFGYKRLESRMITIDGKVHCQGRGLTYDRSHNLVETSPWTTYSILTWG